MFAHLKFNITTSNILDSLGAIYVLRNVFVQVNLRVNDCLQLLIEFLIKEDLDEELLRVRENNCSLLHKKSTEKKIRI